MTAVAQLVFDNKVPLILGDLMLSGPENDNIAVLLPTLEELKDIFPKGSVQIPYSLKQKIVVIGDNLVIGWSGDYSNAKEVIRDLHAENKATPVTKSTLEDFFRYLPRNIWDERNGVGFLGFVKDGQGISDFGYQKKILRTEHFGNVGFLGTGTDDLESLLQKFPNIPSPTTGNPNPLQLAVSFALGFTGNLLSLELATHSSLKNLYGGGYEIASLIDGKFGKVDNVTYLFWKGDVSNASVRISQTPYHLMSFCYQGDILTIRSIYFSNPNSNVSTYQASFAICPMYRIPSKEELTALPIPDLNQKFLCNHFLITSPPSKDFEVYSKVEHAPTGEGSVRLAEEQDKVVLSVKEEFIEGILQEISRRYGVAK